MMDNEIYRLSVWWALNWGLQDTAEKECLPPSQLEEATKLRCTRGPSQRTSTSPHTTFQTVFTHKRRLTKPLPRQVPIILIFTIPPSHLHIYKRLLFSAYSVIPFTAVHLPRTTLREHSQKTCFLHSTNT